MIALNITFVVYDQPHIQEQVSYAVFRSEVQTYVHSIEILQIEHSCWCEHYFNRAILLLGSSHPYTKYTVVIINALTVTKSPFQMSMKHCSLRIGQATVQYASHLLVYRCLKIPIHPSFLLNYETSCSAQYDIWLVPSVPYIIIHMYLKRKTCI